LIGRTIFILISLCVLARPGVTAEYVVIPVLRGQLFADGRPVNQTIEIVLEAQDSSVVARAYTTGSAEFMFRDILLNLQQNYYLFVKEFGYKELRFGLNMNDFVADSAVRSIFHFAGTVMLNLESLPRGKINGKAGPKVVDARQLKAEISEEARRQYNLGLEGIATGDSKAALGHLEKSVELAPEFYDALNRLGTEYLRVGQHREAEAILERARGINPNDPLPLTNLGILHLQEGEKLAPAAAGDGDARLGPGETSFRKALEMFEKALRLNPLAPRANFYLGNALYKLGDYESAESRLLHTLDLDGRMYEARLVLLNIYTRQKRYEGALKQISEYLTANPDSPEKARLERLKAQIENTLNQ
jgi:tetratricopeptide (TPR) repeat protein